MPQRSVQQYTEAQLAREIERVGAKPRGDVTTPEGREAWDNSYDYYKELLAEEARRFDIRGEPTITAGWTIDLPNGRRLRQERVA